MVSRLRRAMGLESRSLEDPKVPLSGRNIVRFMRGGGGLTDAGPVVNEQTALTYLALLACVRIRSEALGAVDIGMYEHSSGAGNARQAAARHPAHYLLHVQPNPEMTATVFRQVMQMHLDTWGNAYARIEWDVAGRPRALWPLRPDLTRPERMHGSYALRYVTTWRDQSNVVLEPEEVLHVVGMSSDGIHGQSPIAMARQAIGVGLAAEEYTAGFYANGATFAGVFEHPEELSEDAEKHLRESLTRHTGAANAFHPFILEEGMKWHQVSLPGEDAMFLGLRQFQRREIGAMYRVPNHMLNDVEAGATHSSIETRSLEFVNWTMAASLKAWEQELTRKLGLGDPRYFAAFDMSGLLRGDSESRAKFYAMGINDGWLNFNEVRARENMPPRPDGDRFREPLNMGRSAPGSDEPGQGPGRKPDGFDESHGGGEGGGTTDAAMDWADLHQVMGERTLTGNAALQVLAEAHGRVLRRHMDRTVRAGRKDRAAWQAWLGQYVGQVDATASELLTPAALVVNSGREAMGAEGVPEARVHRWLVDELEAQASDETMRLRALYDDGGVTPESVALRDTKRKAGLVKALLERTLAEEA